MLIRHPWLAPLLKPPTISEEDEEDVDVDDSAEPLPPTADKEVAEWVIGALERRRNGTMGKKLKPALHTAPLDAVSSPAIDGPS